MIRIPVWLSLLVGGMVVVFGLFRLSLAFRPAEERERARERGGIYGFSRHTQILVGVVYVILGLLLILPAVGVRIPLPWAR